MIEKDSIEVSCSSYRDSSSDKDESACLHGLDEPLSVRAVVEKLFHACHSSDKLVD